MAIVTRQFEQVANFVAEQIAELLCAQVLVVDERGVAIAQSTPFAQEEGFSQWCSGVDLQEFDTHRRERTVILGSMKSLAQAGLLQPE